MDQFLGKQYLLASKENFEDYLIFMGISEAGRKAGLALKPIQFLDRNNDGTYTYSFKSDSTNSHITFALGEEFEETKPDNTKVLTTVTFEDNKMIQISVRPQGGIIKHICEFSPDKLIVTTTADGLDKTVKREFHAV